VQFNFSKYHKKRKGTIPFNIMSKKMKIKVSPLFTKADTVRDTVTGITFTSSSWVEVDVKDGERLLENNMDIFIADDELVEDNEAGSNIGDDNVDSLKEDIFEDIVTEEE
tara:strand:+ start:8027 stop:8356 length:330 start_codon:yes stop_codon:yes gene_type:complete